MCITAHVPMDLIVSPSFSLFVVSTVGVLMALWMENPFVQTFLNMTSVLLKNTEVVWKPVVTALAPLLKPLAPLALLLGKTTVKALILVAEFISKLFVTVSEFTQSLGLNMTQTGKMILYGAKDLVSSLYTVTKALAFLIKNTLSGVSYVIDSFEMVGVFLRKLFFESHLVTWQDVMDIALPFAIVGVLISFVMYRAYTKFVKSDTSCDNEMRVPRRSSRIARKRALLLCNDASDTAFACKKASAKAANL